MRTVLDTLEDDDADELEFFLNKNLFYHAPAGVTADVTDAHGNPLKKAQFVSETRPDGTQHITLVLDFN